MCLWANINLKENTIIIVFINLYNLNFAPFLFNPIRSILAWDLGIVGGAKIHTFGAPYKPHGVNCQGPAYIL